MKPKQFVMVACLLAGILANRGLGQDYASAVNYATGKAPAALATGDFNRDGNMDIVVANSGEASLSLLLGNGDGTFKSAGTIPVGSPPVSVASADFNGDGNPDAAVSLAGSAAVQVLFGNGDGTFQAPVTIPVPVPNLGNISVGQIGAADLSGDGHPDLLLATSSGLYIFMNDGHGGFTANTNIVGPHLNISSFVVADFNQDGRTDTAWIGAELAQCGAASASVFLSFGNGDGTFRDPVALPMTNFIPGGIAAGDFNHDGRMDLVVSEATTSACSTGAPNAGSVEVALQQGDGSFVVSSKLTGIANPGAIIAGDFDGDGNLDIAVLQSSFSSPLSPPQSDAVMIYRGDGSGAFSGPNQFAVPAGPRALAAGTFTNAVALDLAIADANANQLSVLVNQGGSTLALASSSNPAKMHQAVTLTATVQPRFPGNGKLPGSVIFADGKTNLGTAPVNASGVATLTTTFAVKGTHSLVAVYGGNENFVGGSSSTLQQIVNGPPPNVFTQSGPNPSSFGQTVHFTVDVFLPPSGPVPSGTVRLTEGGNVIDTGVLDSTGQVRLLVNTLPVGSHTIVAEYLGDSTFGPANSLPLTQTVTGSSTTTTVNLNSNPSVFGQTVTLTAAVAPGNGFGAPSGTVAFNDGGTNIGTATVDGSGNATLQLNSFNVGNHDISASYSGDSNFQASTSSPVSLTVNQSPTTTSISLAPNPSVFGQAVTLTVIVAPSGGGTGTPSGIVTFSDGANTLGTASLDGSGRTSLTVSPLTVGSHSITASYGGDANFLGSSTAASQTVNKSPTTTNVSSAPNPGVYGQAVTFTAIVAASSGGAGTPSGTVTFNEGANTLGSASVDNTGRASLTVNSLTAGSHNIIGSYSGDGNFLLSSAAASQTVNKSPTTTSVNSTPNHSVHGQTVTLTAIVSASGGGAGTPAGTVTFSDGASTVGSAPLDNTGTASLPVSSLTVGSHSITANYSGDSNFLGSSAAASQTVNKSPTTMSVNSAPNPSVYGQAVTFTAIVAASGGGAGTPSGTVMFNDGASTLGSASLDTSGTAVLTVNSLTAGSHNITASYTGDASFLASTATVSQTVNKSPTTTNVSSAPNPSLYGQAVTFTAIVAASSGGLGTPSGTVTFNEGASTLGSASLDNTGRASLTVNSLAAGSHNITASYSDDGNLQASSAAVSQTVNKSPTTTSVSAAPNPSVYGQAVTVTAVVAASGGGAGTPSGALTFNEGTNNLGSASLDNNGKASLAVNSLTAGSHNIKANYGGDISFLASSASVPQTVGKSPTSTTLTAAPNPSVFGESVTLSVTVVAAGGGAGIPSGNVSLLDAGTAIGTAALDNAGKAVLSISTLSVGTHSLTATYAGDANFNPSSTSGTGGVTLVVNQSSTVTTLSSSSEPSVFGQTVTFTATVAPSGGGAGVPSGTVVFSDGATAIGSEVLDNTGKATLTTSSLAVGSHNLSASYRGNPGFLPSNSKALFQFVNKDSVMMSLFSTPNPSTYGESVTFTLQVSPDQPGGSPGTPLPSGTVTLTEGAGTLGTATLDNSGKATFVISNLPAGSHSIGATYAGDANFSNSILSDHPQEVDKAPTQTTLTSSLNPATNASTILLSAHVSSTVGPVSGSVTFLDGAEPLASVPLDGSGSATLPLSNLSVGSHHFTATYGGDTNFAPSQSAAVNEQIVDSHSAVVLASSANPQTVTKDVTFVASVTPALGGAVSGGTATFSDGPTLLATVPLVNSAASFATTALAVGDHSITASYQAGTAPGPFDGISTPIVQTIKSAAPIVIIGGAKQDFTISVAQPSSDVVAGQTFTTQVTLTPVNGLTGNILTICAGAPSGSTCTVTPDQGTLDGKNSVTATLTVTTTRSGTAAVTAWERTRTPLNGLPRPLGISLLPFALGMRLCFTRTGERRKRRVFTLALLACLLAGCGGTKLRTQSLAANTPPGSYTFTVQSQSGSLAHSSQIILQVK